MSLQDLLTYCSLQLPFCYCFQQYLLLCIPSLFFWFLHPFTQACQINYLLFSSVSFVFHVLVRVKFSNPFSLIVSSKDSSVAFYFLFSLKYLYLSHSLFMIFLIFEGRIISLLLICFSIHISVCRQASCDKFD